MKERSVLLRSRVLGNPEASCVSVWRWTEVILMLESKEEVSKLLGFIFGGGNDFGKPRV